MKRNTYRMLVFFCLFFSLLATVPAHKKAIASQDQNFFVKEICWQLNPYIDTLKLIVEKQGNFYGFYGRWMASGLYSIAVVGCAVPDDVDGGFDFMFTGSDQLDFGHIWHFHAKLDSNYEGDWTFSRDDDFSNSGTIRRIECTTDMAMNGPSANDAH